MDVIEEIYNRSIWDFIAAFLLVGAILLLLLNPINISIILGNSMEPTFSHGDVVVYSEWIDPSDGDVVIFYNTEGYRVAHRVIDQSEPGVYITKGDNNEIRDRTLVDIDKNYQGSVLTHIELSDHINEEYLWRFHPKYEENYTS